MTTDNDTPQEIRLGNHGTTLTILWHDYSSTLTAEYLRVCSPSAEVRAHGGEWRIIGGKKDICIRDIMPVGQYALRLQFSDGHNSGLYTWAVLRDLADNQQAHWQHYLHALHAQGGSRESAHTIKRETHE